MKVSIGRETEDVKVDIDLGKEGRANKISRRQVFTLFSFLLGITFVIAWNNYKTSLLELFEVVLITI